MDETSGKKDWRARATHLQIIQQDVAKHIVQLGHLIHDAVTAAAAENSSW
jgi:hypothetical protein